MFVETVTGLTDDLYEAIQSLIPQLGPDKIVPARSKIESLIQSESSTLLVARHPGMGDPIAGMLTLAIYRVPTGIRSIVEDVIVDENYRRQGIAEALLNKAIEVARIAGAGNVSLSANPSREAAHRLYQKLGFSRRESNFYILRFK
jgi:ribosomal protein S18 acetylase RimI-like enzyme